MNGNRSRNCEKPQRSNLIENGMGDLSLVNKKTKWLVSALNFNNILAEQLFEATAFTIIKLSSGFQVGDVITTDGRRRRTLDMF